MAHHHVDVEEEPGTYRAVWGCAAALVAGVIGIILGGIEMKVYPGLAQATLGLGAVVVLLHSRPVAFDPLQALERRVALQQRPVDREVVLAQEPLPWPSSRCDR